jgi:hypothetical protein
MLPSILAAHLKNYALIEDGEVIGYYSTLEDAQVTANSFPMNHFQCRRSRISLSISDIFRMPLVAGKPATIASVPPIFMRT